MLFQKLASFFFLLSICPSINPASRTIPQGHARSNYINRYQTSSPLSEGHHSRMRVSSCRWSIYMHVACVECLNRSNHSIYTFMWLNDWHTESPLHVVVHVFWHLCGFCSHLQMGTADADLAYLKKEAWRYSYWQFFCYLRYISISFNSTIYFCEVAWIVANLVSKCFEPPVHVMPARLPESYIADDAYCCFLSPEQNVYAHLGKVIDRVVAELLLWWI